MTELESDRIEAYIMERMTPADREAFEAELGSNDKLAREVRLQQELMQALQQARKVQLKQQLSSIPVPTTNYWPVVGGVAGVAMISVVTLWWLNQPAEVAQPVKADQHSATPAIQSTPESQVSTTDTLTKTEVAAAPIKKRVTKAQEPVVAQTPVVNPVDPADEYVTDDPSTQQVESTQPQLGQAEEEDHGVITEIVADTRFNFHYSYEGNHLKLYGKFNRDTYKILDFINEQTGKRVTYLQFKKVFYELSQTEKPVELRAVQDPVLINKLEREAARF